MNPFATEEPAAGLPHAVAPSANTQRTAEEQQKRRAIGVLGVILLLLLAFASSSSPSPSTVPTKPVDLSSRGKEHFDTAAYKAAPMGNGAAGKSVAKDGGLLSEDLSSPLGFRDEKKIVVLLTSKGNGDSCAQSIIAARDLAFRSNRVHFRVVEESSVIHDESCLQIYCDQRPRDCKAMLQSKRLRIIRRDISGALGASVALNLVEGMVEKDTFQDDFYLSVDANVVFTKHWDLELLKQWYSIGNGRAILSVSPPSVETRGLNKGIFFLQCSARIHSKDKDAVVEFNPPEPKLLTTVQGNGATPLHFPVLQSQYSERFHFGRVEALLEVRSDPHLSHLVVGHEYMRATRFWTRGYDFYTPSEDIFYYHYESPLAPDEKGKSDEQILRSSRRVRTLLGLAVSQEGEPLEDADKYRPGGLRSLNDWRVFSSIVPDDKFNESTTNHFVNCDHRLHYKHFTLPTAEAK